MISVPIWSLHHDEEYFPEPERFKPERFLPGAREKIPGGAYLPFGVGPRMCIGEIYGLLYCIQREQGSPLNFCTASQLCIKCTPKIWLLSLSLRTQANHMSLKFWSSKKFHSFTCSLSISFYIGLMNLDLVDLKRLDKWNMTSFIYSVFWNVHFRFVASVYMYSWKRLK